MKEIMMKQSFLRKISSILFCRPSKVLRELNSNALMVEWSRQNTTENIFDNRFDMYEYINSSILHSDRIDFLEFGVFKGESLFRWSEINKNSDSRFYGFDSFEGLPEAWDGPFRFIPMRSFDVGGVVPRTNDKRIEFIKGYFQETLRTFLDTFAPKGRLVVHNDSDIYSSTLYCLTILDEVLVKDSILLFDEFCSSSHEFQAFVDYSRAYRRQYKVLASVAKDPYRQIAIMLE